MKDRRGVEARKETEQRDSTRPLETTGRGNSIRMTPRIMLHALREMVEGLTKGRAIPQGRGWIVKRPAESRAMPTKAGAIRVSRNAPNLQQTETIQRTISLTENVFSQSIRNIQTSGCAKKRCRCFATVRYTTSRSGFGTSHAKGKSQRHHQRM